MKVFEFLDFIISIGFIKVPCWPGPLKNADFVWVPIISIYAFDYPPNFEGSAYAVPGL
jgi:hypothetical protein